MNRRLIGLAAMALAVLPSTLEAQWPQWRGPDRDGLSPSVEVPAQWPEKLRSVWRRPLGSGYSSPVVAGSRVYVHTREGDEEVVAALSLENGQELWRQSYSAPFAINRYAREMEKGPYSTPTVDGSSVYTLGVTGVVSRFDAATGELQWRHDFSKSTDTSNLFCGAAMSPLVLGESVIVHLGDDRKGWVVAFDTETGKERWRHEGDGPGYASPIVWRIGRSTQLVTLTDSSIVGLDSEEGTLLWRVDFADEWNENIVTPVIAGGKLIVSGVRQGTRAFEVERTAAGWVPEEIWHQPEVKMYMSSPVLDGDHLYGLSSTRKGQFFCLDTKTGEIVWATEGREATNASIVASSDHLFLLTEDAGLVVAPKSPDAFEPVARYTVADAATWPHVVVFGHYVLVKDSEGITFWSWTGA